MKIKRILSATLAAAMLLCCCALTACASKPTVPTAADFEVQPGAYRYQDGDLPVRPTDGAERYRVGAAAPIVAEGDLMGCVLLLTEDGAPALDEAEQKLVQTVAGFLGRQMES